MFRTGKFVGSTQGFSANEESRRVMTIEKKSYEKPTIRFQKSLSQTAAIKVPLPVVSGELLADT